MAREIINNIVLNLKIAKLNITLAKKRSRVGLNSIVENSIIMNNVNIGYGSRITESILHDFVKIGRCSYVLRSELRRHSYTGHNCYIESSKIGAFTSISWNVTINPGEHDYNRLTTHEFLFSTYHKLVEEQNKYYNPVKKVNIGNDVWIGCNSVILGGVKIGDGAVIGAGAIVTKNVPDYAIVTGVPAKVLKYRFSRKTILKLKKLEWWNWPINVIKNNIDIFARNPDDPEVLSRLWEIKENINQ